MLSSTPRTQIKKAPHKACSDKARLHEIIDESMIAHIAIYKDGSPFVLPMLAWREGERVYIHGAKNSRLIKSLSKGQASCLTFTLFDGWVLARSGLHHSAHYRTAMVLGSFTVLEGNEAKDKVLSNFIDQIAPGRSGQVRPASESELSATQVLYITLEEASVKIGDGPVNDDTKDMGHQVWAGFIPFKTVVGPLKSCESQMNAIGKPDYSKAYGKRWFLEEKA